MSPEQIEIVRFETSGLLNGHRAAQVAELECFGDRLDDRVRDFILHREHVLELPLVRLRPECGIVFNANKSRGHAKASARRDARLLRERIQRRARAPISLIGTSPLLNANADVRDTTRSPSTFASAFISSSVMPSLKYSVSASELRFEIGSTAIERRGVEASCACAGSASAVGSQQCLHEGSRCGKPVIRFFFERARNGTHR